MSASNNAALADWNFDFSISTGLSGETTSLDDFTFKLLIDVEPTVNTSYRTLGLEQEAAPPIDQQSGFQWRDEGTGWCSSAMTKAPSAASGGRCYP